FASDQCPEGFVSVAKSTLRILTLERLGETFNQQTAVLRYTPRKFVIHPDHRVIIVAEADHGAVPLAQREDLPGPMNIENGAIQEPGFRGPELDEQLGALEQQFGGMRGGQAQWASCVRIIDPTSLQTHHALELDNNEAAVSLCLARFNTAPEEGALLCVGTVKGLSFYPRRADDGFIRIYRLRDAGRRLELMHRTPVGETPGALTAFKGRLLAGCGNILRIYELGKKKLLRKCEHRKLPTHIATLSTLGDRIFVGDGQESFHYMKYKKADNIIYEYADDVAPRYVTSALQLDYDTMCGADKFGNIFMTRLPSDISAQVEDDPTGGKFAGASNLLQGAAHKLEDIINFHAGDTVTALQRAAMQPGGREVILYGTVMGAIGALLPFSSREDVDFFSHLEMHLRQEQPPLAGRDHLGFRSYYFPVKDTIDGDLCEQFPQASAEKQQSIAEELDRTPGEVLKKLEDIRNRVL
ncbi:hypothetical protein WJX84_007420, partial [Apatococcus fuscideae]